MRTPQANSFGQKIPFEVPPNALTDTSTIAILRPPSPVSRGPGSIHR